MCLLLCCSLGKTSHISTKHLCVEPKHEGVTQVFHNINCVAENLYSSTCFGIYFAFKNLLLHGKRACIGRSTSSFVDKKMEGSIIPSFSISIASSFMMLLSSERSTTITSFAFLLPLPYPASRVSFDLPRQIGKRKETLQVASRFFDPPLI